MRRSLVTPVGGVRQLALTRGDAEDDQMAKVNQRPWKLPGQRTRRRAWGFTVQVDGKQKRVYKAQWTREDAEQALAAILLNAEQHSNSKPKPEGLTLAQAADRYLALK